MKSISQIRRENLIRLAAEVGGQSRLADLTETSAVYINQIVRQAVDQKTGTPRSLGTAKARDIEAKVGKPPGWLDHDHQAPPAITASEAELLRAFRGLLDPAARMKLLAFAQGLLAGQPLQADVEQAPPAGAYGKRHPRAA